MLRLLYLIVILGPNARAENPCSLGRILHVIQGEHPSVRRAQELLARKGQPMERHVLFDSPHHGETVELHGVPSSVKAFTYDSNTVFRHYVANAEGFDPLLTNSELKASIVPYVIIHPGVRKEFYPSLEGAFVTLPEYSPRQVGLGSADQMDYFDFTLPEGLGLLELEPGILLIPGNSRHQPWVMEAYERWKASGSNQIPTGYEKSFGKIEAQLGQEQLKIPIKIKSYRKNGEIKILGE